MGANLTKRDGSRFRLWQAGFLTIVLALTLGMIRSGASWGSSNYDAAADPYSMQNVTGHGGLRPWWHAGLTGQGVDVALVDTGVSPVPGLDGSGKVVNGPDLSLESQNPTFRYLDTNGHGTFMAGIIGGNDGQPGGYRGVAPDSRILSVKVGDADGGVDVTQVIAAVDWIVQHRYDDGMNIRVINLSYGTNSRQSYTNDPLAYAVEQAWKAGIVVVVAAGNTGFYSGLSDPAYDPWLISVGAADTMGTAPVSDDQPAAFTATAKTCKAAVCNSVTLLAPGAHMEGLRDPGSYIDQNNPNAALGNLNFRGSGTSEAAAYVTGAVTLLLQKYPSLSPDQVKAMLVEGSQHLRGYSPLVQGYGELNMVKLMNASVPSAPTPTPNPAPPGPGTPKAPKPGKPTGPPPPPGAHTASGPGAPGAPAGPGGPQWSNGSGSIEQSRGTDHLALGGVVLHGEKDIFGRPFNSHAMADLEARFASWSGGIWDGSSWSGSSWSGSSWSGSSWSGSSWSGSSWSGSSWSGLSWSGNSWSGSSWSGSSWSGNSWSGSSWSGLGWSGAGWLGDQWLGASWG